MRLFQSFALFAVAAALSACGSGTTSTTNSNGDGSGGSVTVISPSTADEPSYALCSSSMTKTEFLKLMDGNLTFVEQADTKGQSAAQAVGQLVEMIVVNGLDFDKLASYSFQFSDGDYTFKSGDDGYTFSLFFASDWEGHKAGDKITDNVFDYTSYLSNPSVTLIPSPKVTYDHGPLYDLIDGSVSADGESLSSLKVSFKIHAELVAFALSSANTYNGSPPRDQDTLYLKMTTTQAALPTIASQFAAGGYGLLLDGTTYDSVFYGIKQTYGSSPALLENDAQGYYWQLNTTATVVKSGITLYQTGVASQRTGNTTSYFCDANHKDAIGVATLASDLNSGSFKFADGTEVDFGLEDF